MPVISFPSGLSSVRQRARDGSEVSSLLVSGEAMAIVHLVWPVRSKHVSVASMLLLVPFTTCEDSSPAWSVSVYAPAAGDEDIRERLART